jgi:hypothetical protein
MDGLMRRLLAITLMLLIPSWLQAQMLQAIVAAGNRPTANTPTFSPVAGAVSNPTTVTASSTTSGTGCTMYFDTSNPPTTAQTTYSVTTGVTLYAQLRNCAGYGNSLVGSAVYTISSGYSDNFPGSSLSGNWTCYSGSGYTTPTVSSSQVHNPQGGSTQQALCGYTAGTFGANSTSQASVGSSTSSSFYTEMGICIHVNPSTGNAVCLSGNGGGYSVASVSSGTTAYVTNGTCYGWSITFALGDVINISNSGSTITVNDVTQSKTCTSTYSISGGYAGFLLWGNEYSQQTAWAAWSGS